MSFKCPFLLTFPQGAPGDRQTLRKGFEFGILSSRPSWWQPKEVEKSGGNVFSLQFLQDFLLPKSGKTTDDEWVQFFFRDQLICIRTAKLILKPPSWCGHPHPAMCEVLFRIFGNSWKKKKLLRLPMTSSWQRPRNDSGVGKFLEFPNHLSKSWDGFSWTRLKLEERKLWSKAEQPTETFADFFSLEVEVAIFEYERYSLCFMPMHRFLLSLSAHCGGTRERTEPQVRYELKSCIPDLHETANTCKIKASLSEPWIFVTERLLEPCWAKSVAGKQIQMSWMRAHVISWRLGRVWESGAWTTQLSHRPRVTWRRPFCSSCKRKNSLRPW